MRKRKSATTIEERIWSKVTKGAPDECWLWHGSTNVSNAGRRYGYLVIDKKFIRVNRLICGLTEPFAVNGLVARHKCDNTLCCNPTHLESGTQKENVQDRYDRGRDNHACGSNHGSAKLTEGQVIEIRAAAKTGEAQRSIAARYGVTTGAIQWALQGWKHVPKEVA